MTKREKRKWKHMHPKRPSFELGRNDDKDEGDHDDDDDDDKHHHKVSASLLEFLIQQKHITSFCCDLFCCLIAIAVLEIGFVVGK